MFQFHAEAISNISYKRDKEIEARFFFENLRENSSMFQTIMIIARETITNAIYTQLWRVPLARDLATQSRH